MVKDYLDLSRAERGGFHPVLRSIDLRTEVIEPSVALSDGLFRSRAIHLDVNDSGGPTLHPGLPVRAASITVDADPELLRIALGNLLSNAAKYGRDGGRAELALRLEEDAVTVSVENDGEGFRPEEAEQLFTKFTRLRNANTKTKKGSGLGLFLTARIVEAHGGRVWAESEPGQWARFGFRLPLHPPVPSDA